MASKRGHQIIPMIIGHPAGVKAIKFDQNSAFFVDDIFKPTATNSIIWQPDGSVEVRDLSASFYFNLPVYPDTSSFPASPEPGDVVFITSTRLIYVWDSLAWVPLTTGSISFPIAVGQGGTGTTTAFAAGQVFYAGTGGVHTSEGMFFWNSTSKRLGLNQGSPSTTLHVGGAYHSNGTPVFSVAPIANPPATWTNFDLRVTTRNDSVDRQWAMCAGLTSNQGGGDKVTIYGGLSAQAGTSDVWSLNTVLTQEAGSGSYNAQGYELDFNNLVGDRGNDDAGFGLAAPVSYGLSVTGIGPFRSTAAILLSGTYTGAGGPAGMWNRGIVIANDCIANAVGARGSSFQDLGSPHKSIDLRGNPTYSIYQSSPTAQNWLNGPVKVGAATGGSDGFMGAGTLNVAVDVYKNGVAYTHPGYVFEMEYTGKVDQFRKATGAGKYDKLWSLGEIEEYTKENLQLPRMAIEEAAGVFGRSDAIIATVEELYLHVFKLAKKVEDLEKEVKTLKAELDGR